MEEKKVCVMAWRAVPPGDLRTHGSFLLRIYIYIYMYIYIIYVLLIPYKVKATNSSEVDISKRASACKFQSHFGYTFTVGPSHLIG